MPEKFQSETLTLAGSLNESWYIGYCEAVFSGLHHSQVGMQRGKRVIRALGGCGGERGNEARLASRGIPNECDIRDSLQLKRELPFFAKRAQQREAGSFALRRCEAPPPRPTPPRTPNKPPVAGVVRSRDLSPGGGGDARADRHRKLQRF